MGGGDGKKKTVSTDTALMYITEREGGRLRGKVGGEKGSMNAKGSWTCCTHNSAHT